MIKNKFDRLVVFGCSYANGEEILYHELGDDLAKLHESTKNDPRIFLDKVKSNIESQRKYEEIKVKQLEKAWPKKLADKLNIPCLNFSESGNSMQRMLWQLLIKIKNKEIFNTDLILISQTKPERNFYFRNDRDVSFQISSANGPIKNQILGISKDGNLENVLDESFDKSMIQWFNDERIYWDFITTLMAMKSLQTELNLFVVPTMTFPLDIRFVDYAEDFFKESYTQLLNSDLFLTLKNLDNFIQNKTEVLPWGHPNEIVQDRFADYLYNEIH